MPLICPLYTKKSLSHKLKCLIQQAFCKVII
nr:MAG TPA: hypothetical protein [Caudoviricetes sp.]